MQIQNISITIHQCTALSFLFVQYMRRYSRYGHAEDITCRATVEPVQTLSTSCRARGLRQQNNKIAATKKDAGNDTDDTRWRWRWQAHVHAGAEQFKSPPIAYERYMFNLLVIGQVHAGYAYRLASQTRGGGGSGSGGISLTQPSDIRQLSPVTYGTCGLGCPLPPPRPGNLVTVVMLINSAYIIASVAY